MTGRAGKAGEHLSLVKLGGDTAAATPEAVRPPVPPAEPPTAAPADADEEWDWEEESSADAPDDEAGTDRAAAALALQAALAREEALRAAKASATVRPAPISAPISAATPPPTSSPAPLTEAPRPDAPPRPETTASRSPSVVVPLALPPLVATRGAAPQAPAILRRRPVASVLRFVGRALLLLLLALGAGALIAVLVVWWGLRDLPLEAVLPDADAPTLSLRTADGRPLAGPDAGRAAFVPLEGFPTHLIDAVLAVEDQRFFEHPGVDARAVARAFVRNVGAGDVVEGGSTITQQLVKLLYLDPDRTLLRKVQEGALALALDRQLGKDRVLELYLNAVYLGGGSEGMPAAALATFGKPVDALTVAESAVLAATIRQPSRVSLGAAPEAARARGDLVLRLMEAQGRLDAAVAQDARAQLAGLAVQPPAPVIGAYFAEWVAEELAAIEGAAGADVAAIVTLDPALQAEAERIVRDVMAAEGAAAGATQAALVAMTPAGEVRAMVGGLDHAASQFNRATDARRQPGSTFKLFVYMAALVMGATPERLVEDAPIAIDGWEPANFDGATRGTVTLAQAFAQSLNLATVNLAQEVGVENVVAVARQFGIEGTLAATPSLALGTSEVTLLDMTEAYAALALGRVPVRATGLSSVALGAGAAPIPVALMGPGDQVQLTRTREPMLSMLRAAVEEGTGRAAALTAPTYGKTGTSQDSRDAWFVGFAGGLVVGVWVGNDDDSPMADVTGGGLPAEIWRQVMLEALPGSQAATSATPVQCDVEACASRYRSFRASDCTFQPFAGPRRVCER